MKPGTVPTDEQIQALAAELCGYELDWDADEDGWHTIPCYTRPAKEGNYREYAPQFCTDWEALPEIWEAVRERGQEDRFAKTACRIASWIAISGAAEAAPRCSAYYLLTLPLRFQVIAAIAACQMWPIDWNYWGDLYADAGFGSTHEAMTDALLRASARMDSLSAASAPILPNGETPDG